VTNNLLEVWDSTSDSDRKFILHDIQTVSGAHLGTVPTDTGSSLFELKRPERESSYSPPQSADVKNDWSYTFTSPQVFMVCCSNMHKYNKDFCKKGTAPQISIETTLEAERPRFNSRQWR